MTEPAKWQLEVLQVRRAGEDYAWIHLAAPADWQSRPGQFVNVLCSDEERGESFRVLDDGEDGGAPGAGPDGRASTGDTALDDREGGPWPQARGGEIRAGRPFVRRPVSISYVAPQSGGEQELVLLVRMVGPGSRWVGQRRPGERLDLVGPLGNGFDLSRASDRCFLVGGGCGIAPLVGAARELVAARKQAIIFYGCSGATNIPLTLPKGRKPATDAPAPIEGVAEMPEAPLVIATEDGSRGTKGLVTDALSAYASLGGWRGVSLFACGPDAMMAAVAELAGAHNVRCCQVSLENYMGCGVGVCLSCAAKVRSDGPPGWTYKLACKDGPVFEAAEVVFEGQEEGCQR